MHFTVIKRTEKTWIYRRKHMEDVRISPQRTSAKQQHTDSKMMGVPFDTSLYT